VHAALTGLILSHLPDRITISDEPILESAA
jgi:hypothetical protein